MSQTNTMICRHLGVRDENTVLLYIAPDEFNATVDALQKAGKSQKLLRIIAAGNIMLGEPALVHVEMYDNNLIYHRGDVVYEERLTAQELSGNAELQVMRFLHNVTKVGLSLNRPLGIVTVCKGLSLNDCFWVDAEGSGDTRSSGYRCRAQRS